MSSTLDLDRYFRRIGYTGPQAATLDVLRELHRLHPLSIPFENLDSLTGRRVELDLSAVVDKLIGRKRGGYCFEQNRLFAHVLMQLGFDVTPMIARPLWGREPDAITPRTHMLLRVNVDDQPWIADVGFGAATLTAPMRLQAGAAQPTTHEPFRLADAAHGAFDLEVQTGETWTKMYRFDLQRAEWVDYDVSNWYTSTHPDSFFTTSLVVCRVTPEGRLTLFNDRLTARSKDGEAIERHIESAHELETCLRDTFMIQLGDIDVAAIYGRVSTEGAAS
ncbi:arylamine N-acetyltransferase [Paraburkholderia sp. C35]|uniref:arylamine N-acetyltransferase family protein n=1 Tax=Paraburkholderia sp. C35 TaxID=2126993 RepID=UPI000D6923EE|nr:arylamine N-acetyltransferase [Paraburkholderia sp. C35]